MSQENKTHYRKAFNSPYLSSVDIVNDIEVTVALARIEPDKSKKTRDELVTVYFTEKEIRPGEPLKPMVFNATNSKMMKSITNSPFLEDWAGHRIHIYVDSNVRFGRDTVEGLRIKEASTKPQQPKELTPAMEKNWNNAIAAYIRDGNLDAVEARLIISADNRALLIAQADAMKGEQNGDNVE